ncbi:MAG TPA: dTDP-4-dehydrorhamnose reductase [Chthoniobacterales bacterium]|jgi:dTDP-4-dehydrorhamnose reductase
MRVVITGSGGRLGAALLRDYAKQFDVTGFNHAQLDLGDLDRVRATIDQQDFDLLINAAAFTNVDLAEKEKAQAFRINSDAPRLLAEICREKGAQLIHVSTDYVFKGDKTQPYVEQDEPDPISVYGQSKCAGEAAVLSESDRHLVVRVSWVFGPERPSFIDQMIAMARESDQIAAVADKVSTPTYTRDIAEMLMKVVAGSQMGVGVTPNAESGNQLQAGVNGPSRTGLSGYSGILHIANSGECTWQQYAQQALDCCRRIGMPLKASTVGALKMSDMKNWIARRPIRSVLSTRKYADLTGQAPRSWQDAVAEYVRDFVAR